MSELLKKVEKINFEEENNKALPKEVYEIMQILDIIENHTAQLRQKILNEITQDNSKIHLNLNRIDD